MAASFRSRSTICCRSRGSDNVPMASRINVEELRSLSQAGLELAASVKGKANDTTTYEVGVEALTPFLSNKKAGDNNFQVKILTATDKSQTSMKLNQFT